MEIIDTIAFTDQEGYPGKLSSYKRASDHIEIEGESGLLLKIYCISNFILRFRYGVEGFFDDDFSYAIDPHYKPSEVHVQIEESPDKLTIHTPSVVCEVAKKNLRINILDKEGKVLCQDEKGFHWEANKTYGGYIVQNSKKIQDGEAFYGLGDKPTDLNLFGKRFVNWGMDEYGYHRDTDPLYKSIPIYYGLHNHGAYGIFFDNTFKSFFDFGKEREQVTSFWAQGGEMNYYFIAGPKLMDVCSRYTIFTGTPDMPPMWALGYQQCKWSYYPESKVKEIASKMRALQIPCDAIYLDIDYMDGFRCFTWDKERFPNPKKMVDELKDQGFQTMVIIDPGIKKDNDYPIFNEALEKGYFCQRADGPLVQGKVWPGECYFPDFTRPEVRTWWADLYQDLIEEIGIAGVWNDMNEPALFDVEGKTFPDDVLHDYDGHLTSHRKAHNIYGMQMARATAEGVKKYRRGKRTLIITRSGYAGLQRYSSVWTGDNIASWEHLWLADVQAQRLSISGISFCGSDIGGFIDQPTAELMIRWIQLGIFHPFCRVHSSGDHGDQEPWSFGGLCTDIFRKFVELRYQLLPYLYTTFYQYHKAGIPMIRPLVFFDHESMDTKDRDHEFLCGDHILVCPVIKEKSTMRKVYLPKGRWYDYWEGLAVDGSKEYMVATPLDRIPIYIKEGAIIPKYPIQQYVGEKHIDQITLDVYYKDGQESSQLYEDQKENYDYEKGDYLLSQFTLTGTSISLKIEQTTQGNYSPDITSYKLNIIGLPFNASEIEVDGDKFDIKSTSEIVVPPRFTNIEVSG